MAKNAFSATWDEVNALIGRINLTGFEQMFFLLAFSTPDGRSLYVIFREPEDTESEIWAIEEVGSLENLPRSVFLNHYFVTAENLPEALTPQELQRRLWPLIINTMLDDAWFRRFGIR